MEPIMHHQELHSLREINKSQLIKKTLQFMLSLSIFSFLFSYSSWIPFFLHSFNLYSSTIDRKYMFLLCNGIVVFVTRNSGLIASSRSWTDLHDEYFTSNGDRLRSQPEFSEVNYVVEKEVLAGVGSMERFVVEEGGVVGNGFLITQGGEHEENESSTVEVEGEEKEDDESGLLSTEELNKKFDEFIKKMKEKIRIEAQQLVIF